MDVVTPTLHARFQLPVCRIQLRTPDGSNRISRALIADLWRVLERCDDDTVTVVVVEGTPEVFCGGADFAEVSEFALAQAGTPGTAGAEPLYDLWHRLASGPWISVAHVRGRANAGGLGFVSACDVVLADENAQFSLSELLFGLLPACVLPFLIRRIGFQRASYLTLMTRAIPAQQACEWGLVDACDPSSEALLRNHLLRLRRISKAAITRYKAYVGRLVPQLGQQKAVALEENLAMFANPAVLAGIHRFVQTGAFPWEGA